MMKIKTPKKKMIKSVTMFCENPKLMTKILQVLLHNPNAYNINVKLRRN